jgi:glutathionyl-hydroquinone reductase
MSNKEQLTKFLNALANDKYTEADELFPKVVDSAIKNIINNNKPEVLKKLNANAESIATAALNFDKPAEIKEKDQNAPT